MNSSIGSQLNKCGSAVVLISLALFVSGCSSSNDSVVVDDQASNDVVVVAENPVGSDVVEEAANPVDNSVVGVDESPASNDLEEEGENSAPSEIVEETGEGNNELPSEESEQTADSNSVVDDVPQPVQASIELVPDKTFRITWQTTLGATRYRVLENSDGASGFSDISGQLDANTSSFDHRVALYARVNAQYLVQACNDQGCSDSVAVMVSGTLDNAIGYIKASNTDSVDSFGSAVSLSADGNTLAVGAASEDSAATGINGDQNDNSVEFSGAVYVFARNDDRWQQQAYLKASNTGRSDAFGTAVSLSADGNTLAVGAVAESSAATGVNGDQNDDSAEFSGAVYMFVRNDEQWQQQAYLKASNTEAVDRFGFRVSLSANGNTVAVGAQFEDSAAIGINGNQSNNSAPESGAVYVFVRNAEQWQQQAYLKASNTQSGDFFGADVSLSADGDTLVVGANQEDSGASGIGGDQGDNTIGQSGAAYVFVRSNEQWQQQAYLKASNPGNTDFFGSNVSLSAVGNTLAIGATWEDSTAMGIDGDQNDNSAIAAGAVYVFVRSEDQWQQQAYLKASNTAGNDRFGSAVSLSEDGNTLAIGSLAEDSSVTGVNGDQFDFSASDSGAVYVFDRSGGLWQQRAYVKASNTDQDDNFGGRVSLSSDGDTLVVGVSSEGSAAIGINGVQNDNSAANAGAVYVY